VPPVQTFGKQTTEHVLPLLLPLLLLLLLLLQVHVAGVSCWWWRRVRP
jgi:hypothetical protein